jgi:hypothetical protein
VRGVPRVSAVVLACLMVVVCESSCCLMFDVCYMSDGGCLRSHAPAALELLADYVINPALLPHKLRSRRPACSCCCRFQTCS